MTSKAVLLVIILISMISCQRILEEKRGQSEQENYTSPYMGRFIGKYSGEENGDLMIKVAKNGDVFGNFGLNNEIITGTVLENGALLQVHSINSNFTLLGNFRNQNGIISGTWKQNERTGIWSLTKQ